jgi:hypothetical protein
MTGMESRFRFSVGGMLVGVAAAAVACVILFVLVPQIILLAIEGNTSRPTRAIRQQYGLNGTLIFEVQNASIEVGGQRYGFSEYTTTYPLGNTNLPRTTLLHLGWAGDYRVSVTAKMGLALTATLLLTLIVIVGAIRIIRTRRTAQRATRAGLHT